MNRFEAVIFDMDGLLLDTERLALLSFNKALEEFGLDSETELFMKTIGTNSQACKNILRDGLKGKVDADKFGRIWFEIYKEKTIGVPIPIKEGAIDLLNHVKEIGLNSAVATSTKTELATEKLMYSGLLGFFELVVGGERVQNGKPEPDIYLLAAKELSVNPNKCLALEDSENGVKSAVSAGMRVIQVPDLVEPSEAIKSLGHIIVKSLSDVKGYTFA